MTAARRFHVVQQWRSFSTITETQSSRRGPSTTRAARPRTWQPEENLRSLHPRMIFVRPWDGVPSMAHAFAIVRGVERLFGKIEEFVVLRDSDVLTTNMPYMHLTFARAEYADAIPLEGRVIQIAAPKVDLLRSGGVGLDDLEAYLDPDMQVALAGGDGWAKEAGEDGPGPDRPGKFMDVKLERSGMRTGPPPLDFHLGRLHRSGPPHLRNPARAKELAEAVLSFGGFTEASGEQGQGRTRMQMVMAHWGKTAGGVQAQAPQEKEKQSVADAAALVDDVSWTPFKASAADSDPTARSASSIPSPPPTSSPYPPAPSSSQSSSPKQSAPPLNIDPTPHPKPAPQPATPQLSKKQRVLSAARSAGAAAVATKNIEDEPVSDVGAAETGQRTEHVSEPQDREEDNKRAASKWWSFLTGGKS